MAEDGWFTALRAKKERGMVVSPIRRLYEPEAPTVRAQGVNPHRWDFHTTAKHGRDARAPFLTALRA